MSDRLMIFLAGVCLLELVAAPFLIRRMRERRRRLAAETTGEVALERFARAHPRLALATFGCLLALVLAAFGALVHNERNHRHAEFLALRIGTTREELLMLWGPPSSNDSIARVERRWGYRAVEERGTRATAGSYLVWWGTFDIATARVVGFDEQDRAVLLSWGGT
jgi:hypothetical protein